jgi:hypothetical protein
MAQVYAAQARIEAMKAANSERERQGMAQAYPESAFGEEAKFIDMTACDIQAWASQL